MKSARLIYRETLVNLAEHNPKIICMEADLGGDPHPFQQAFPERFFNIGIAEHTMINMAAGLAKSGYVPFISTFAPFAVLRACEAIKLSMAYMHANVKLICPYAGVSGAWFGPTHHCLEDMGVLQTFPGLTILAPYASEETQEAIRWAAQYRGPVYIRMGRNGVYNNPNFLDTFVFDKPRRIGNWNKSAKLLLVSVGEVATDLVIRLQNEGDFSNNEIAHLHLPFVQKSALKNCCDIIQDFQTLLVVEEARSFGSVASSLALLNPKQAVHSFTPNDLWPSIGGTHEEVLQKMDFTFERLQKTIFTHLTT